MAYLTKTQYDYRRESAAARMDKNAEIGVESGLTEEQTEALETLCTFRHELHTSWTQVWNAESGEHSELIRQLDSGVTEMLWTAGLTPAFKFNVDDIETNATYDIGMDDASDEERKNAYNEAYEKTCRILSNVNRQIESYLEAIDAKYGTSYAPTGALRKF